MKPNALESWGAIASTLSSKKCALFLDYDGTLTPIVARPELARLSNEMRALLITLSRRTPLAIISGRDRKNVQEFVGIDGIYYAGSHGFDIIGPDCTYCVVKKGDEWCLSLEALSDEIIRFCPDILVERKVCSIALHYRSLIEADLGAFEDKIQRLSAKFPKFKVFRGKKVVEFQPDVGWNKGKALLKLLEVMHLEGGDVCPIYIGDDVTDEDAFQSIQGKGIGIAVLDSARDTCASFTLRSVEEVKKVLERL